MTRAFSRRDLAILAVVAIGLATWGTGLGPTWLERPPHDAEGLRSPLASERLAALQWMDREQMRDAIDVLLSRAQLEQDPIVRRELVRELGYTGDPRVLPVLVAELDGEHADAAIESLGYLATPEACRHVFDALADRELDLVASHTLFDTGWRCLDQLDLATDEDRRLACSRGGVATFPALERFRARHGCAGT